ncbi:hypothetical protein HPP92_020548 [Vanilla planifolia]|uniref:Protein NEDD1 n=1 Tax=Vanilla planifolia TaxID=51239 RepID=A0A835Q2J4_VANPL|nr:hypothetical protein HPP92_020548 [Vanilla planifolia]
MLGSQIVSTPVASSKSDSSFSPAPEERVGTAMLEKSSYHQHFLTVSRHLPSASSSTFTSLQDSSSSTIPSTKSVLTNPTFSSLNQQTKAISTNEKPLAYLESSSLTHTTSVSVLLDTKQVTSANFEIPGPLHSSLPRRYTTYADRLITASSIDGISSSIISPKSKKTGSETREELLSTLLSRQDSTAATGNGSLQSINGMATQALRATGPPSDLLGNSSFSLQLVQRTLEETLGSMQKSIHDDVKNLHIDLLRQFHMQEMVISNLVNSVLEKQDELIKEVQTLRRENQQLRQLL